VMGVTFGVREPAGMASAALAYAEPQPFHAHENLRGNHDSSRRKADALTPEM
jgi:hypothetical protein